MSGNGLKPISKKLLCENAVDAIRTAIFSGELKLGQRVVETDLSEQLGVSRGPIREALRLLANEGLVVINVHRGTFVTKPTAEDVEEIYTLREVLENLALRRVVELATDEEIQSLEEQAEQFRAATRHKKVDQLVGLSMELHGQLFNLARHNRLMQGWSALKSQLQLCSSMETERTQQDLTRSVEEHAKIIKALKNRNAETACRLMSHHIRNAMQTVQKSVEHAELGAQVRVPA
jgi:DNA-binding GntR family transcriptional regulator